ncbi:hypothetical protein B0T18DRAFT_42185 [Schizothecium vesticola]|uniref:Uncharacterized protein n=1 Tax=Schizothecium vesticola TaxID=314040 RepID=A0AA40FBK8_9PEZI|nr:hypothetical protein B0T18DRAFT_42185 [Schizothecium vesticola]
MMSSQPHGQQVPAIEQETTPMLHIFLHFHQLLCYGITWANASGTPCDAHSYFSAGYFFFLFSPYLYLRLRQVLNSLLQSLNGTSQFISTSAQNRRDMSMSTSQSPVYLFLRAWDTTCTTVKKIGDRWSGPNRCRIVFKIAQLALRGARGAAPDRSPCSTAWGLRGFNEPVSPTLRKKTTGCGTANPASYFLAISCRPRTAMCKEI